MKSCNVSPAWQTQKEGGDGGGRKARKRGKGKGARAI